MESKSESRKSGSVSNALFYGGGAVVPLSVATCPECGGQLHASSDEWEVTTGCPTSITVNCMEEELRLDEWENNDDDERSHSEVAHKWHQSDWQPIVDTVREWAVNKRRWGSG
jgi:hypothetical protein